MRFLIIALLTIYLCWPSLSLGQRSPNWVAGTNIADGLLMRLTNPKRTDFRVGIINTALEAGVLISPMGAPSMAEYFGGYSTDKVSTWNLSWSAREQLDVSVDRLAFEVLRKSISSRGCSDCMIR